MPVAKVAVQWRPSAQPPLALYATGHRALAVAFAVLVVTNSILVRR